MVVGVFGLVVVILHRGNAVLKATQTAAEHWCGFPQLDGVLTVYAALYDVAVCGQVLNTVCNEGGQQLIAQLDTAVLCTGVGGDIDRHARLIAGDVEEHELAVLGHGEGNIVIRGGVLQRSVSLFCTRLLVFCTQHARLPARRHPHSACSRRRAGPRYGGNRPSVPKVYAPVTLSAAIR